MSVARLTKKQRVSNDRLRKKEIGKHLDTETQLKVFHGILWTCLKIS